MFSGFWQPFFSLQQHILESSFQDFRVFISHDFQVVLVGEIAAQGTVRVTPGTKKGNGLVERERQAGLVFIWVDTITLSTELPDGFGQREAGRLKRLQVATNCLLANAHLGRQLFDGGPVVSGTERSQ